MHGVVKVFGFRLRLAYESSSLNLALIALRASNVHLGSRDVNLQCLQLRLCFDFVLVARLRMVCQGTF